MRVTRFVTTIGLKAPPEFIICDLSFGHKIRLFSVTIVQAKRLRRVQLV
jgi:hypothetical protein